MDDIDKYIEKVITQKIEVPKSFETAIKEALYSEKFYKRLRKRKIIKTLTLTCASIILTSGVAIGGFIAYEKIWKEPKKYTYEELQDRISQTDVISQEKTNYITEEEVREKAMRIIENLGYKGENIVNIELYENELEQVNDIYYKVETINDKEQKLNLKINAKTGELEALQDENIFKDSTSIVDLSEEDKKVALNEAFEKIELDKDQYEIISSENESIVYKGNKREVWNVKGNRKYNNIVNPYEELTISFVMNDNDIKVCSIVNNKNGVYEDNEQIITKEEAIDIATKKEKEFTDKEIVNIEASLDIKKMNKYIFELENNSSEMNNDDTLEGTYKMNVDTIRNVWRVKMYHNLKKDVIITKTYCKDQSKEYYIDCTTGEIIGGKTIIEDEQKIVK